MAITINKANIRVPLKIYDQRWRIVYLDKGGNEQILGDNSDTDSNRIIFNSITHKSLRYGLSDFNAALLNDNGYYNKILKKAMQIKIYADHTRENPTNQIGDIRIDNIKHSLSIDNEFIMNIYGRSNPQLADRKDITKDFSDGANADAAIKEIIDGFFNGIFTYNNIATDMTQTIYGEYINQSALSIIRDILLQARYDGYIDFSNDINTFKEGTRKNSREKIIYGDNLLPYSDVGIDYVDEVNRLTVYGKTDDGILLLRTKEDTALQNESWIKSQVLNASELTTINTVNQKAQIELDFLKQNILLGTLIASNGLPTLLPAQSLFCSSQFSDIHGFFPITQYTHNLFQNGSWTTSVIINRIDTTLSPLVQIQNLNKKITSINAQNLQGMTNTAILLKFDDTTQINDLGDCILADSVLKLSSNVTEATMISSVAIMDIDATKFEVRAKNNDDCAISSFQISSDGGLTFNDNEKKYNLVGDLNKGINFTKSGKLIQAKITLKSNSDNSKPEVDNFTVLIK